MALKLFKLPTIGVMIGVVELEIGVLRQLVLDYSLVYFLSVVLLCKRFFNIPISFLLSLSQDGWLDHLEVCVDDLCDVSYSLLE